MKAATDPHLLAFYFMRRDEDDPGHVGVGKTWDEREFWGFRFDPLDLPEGFQPRTEWREYFLKQNNTVRGNVVEETDAVHVQVQLYPAHVKFRRWPITIHQVSKWGMREQRGIADYSFKPEEHDKPASRCFNCVSWAVEELEKIAPGCLERVHQGRIKEIAKQFDERSCDYASLTS